MNLADFLRQGPLAQQRMADASAFDRDSELANMMRQHGTVQDPNMVQEPSVLGNLPIDVPQPTEQDMQLGAEQIMGMMPMAGITAFHGSPHKFTKFDMSKIGTGEGAQAYGHGIYAAENPKVAKEYLNPDANYKRAYGHLNNRQEFVKDMMDQGREKEDVWQMTQEKYGEWVDPKDLSLDFKSIWSDGPGNLYKVDIPDDQIAKMLDWDKPLKDQPQSVKDFVKQRKQLPNLKKSYKDFGGAKMTGHEIHQWLKSGSGVGLDNPKSYGVAENQLLGGGVPGIKYLDGGSRSGGQGTSNFVLFADDIAKILERNDQPIGELAEGLKTGSKLPMDEASRMGRAKDMGHTVDAYHGSTRDINEFSNKYGSPEGHYGPNHYFTNSQDDVGKNYAGEGPDLTQRLEIKAEQIKDDAAFHDPILKSKIEEMGGKSWDDFEYDEKLQLTRKLAKDHLGLENQGVTYPVKLNMKNPVKTHGKDETFFDYQAKYDDDPSSPYYEEFLGEEGKFIDLLDETQQAMRKWGVDNADDVMGKLQEANINMEGLKASEFEDVIRNNIYEAYDQAGEMASPGALIADIYKRMGYDGIEMNAYDHFGGGRPFGKAMEGVDQDTLHHIVFEPNQIRSKFAKFDPANKNSGNILAGAGAGFLASQLLGQDR